MYPESIKCLYNFLFVGKKDVLKDLSTADKCTEKNIDIDYIAVHSRTPSKYLPLYSFQAASFAAFISCLQQNWGDGNPERSPGSYCTPG